MNANPTNNPGEGMEVVPSQGGAVIKLSPEALQRMKRGLERAGLAFIQLAPIIQELQKSLELLGEAWPQTTAGLRLDPAFSGPPQHGPAPLDHPFHPGEEDPEWCAYNHGSAEWHCGRPEADHHA